MKQNIYDTKATGKTHLTRDQQAEDNIQLRKRKKKQQQQNNLCCYLSYALEQMIILF